MSQFAVCPICCNPIQVIHLYPDKADDLRPPYEKHIKHDLEGLGTYSQESYDACRYANPTRHDFNARRHESTISSGILYILQEQYIANKGYTFVYSTPMNIPWMLAYRGGKHGLFGQKIADELLRESILKHEPPDEPCEKSTKVDSGITQRRIYHVFSFFHHGSGRIQD